MDKIELWDNFELSGKIEDYLKYKMENIVENEVLDETIQSEGNCNKGDSI